MSVHKEALDRAKLIAQIEALNEENRTLSTKTLSCKQHARKPQETYLEGTYVVEVYPPAGKRKSYCRRSRGELRQSRERIYGKAKLTMDMEV